MRISRPVLRQHQDGATMELVVGRFALVLSCCLLAGIAWFAFF